jgi:hypothetical protein
MNLTAFRAEGIKARSTGAETIYPPIRVGLDGEASNLDGWHIYVRISLEISGWLHSIWFRSSTSDRGIGVTKLKRGDQ